MSLQLPNVKAALLEAAGGISRIWYGWFRGVQQHVDDKANPHGTTAAQAGADASGTATAAVSAHVAAADPHASYANTEGRTGGQSIAGAPDSSGALSLLGRGDRTAAIVINDPTTIQLPSFTPSMPLTLNGTGYIVGQNIDHATQLNNIGSNTHAQIDTHLGAASPHSGHATLSAGKVVQDPANSQTAAAASKIPLSGVAATIDAGWIPSLSYLPSSGGTVSGWVSISGASNYLTIGGGSYLDKLKWDIGASLSGDRNPTINFGAFGDSWGTGWNATILDRASGQEGTFSITNRGANGIVIDTVSAGTGAGPIVLKTASTARLTIAAAGGVTVNGDTFVVATAKTPASAVAAGTAGQIAWDANYIYVCTAANTWKRVAIATW